MITDLTFAIGRSIVLSLLVKATLVLACMLLASAIATRASAASRHLMLAAGFAALLLLPIVSVTVPTVPIGMTVTQPVVNSASRSAIQPLATGTPGAEPFRALEQPAQDPLMRPRVSFALVALGVWVAGIVLNLVPVLRALLESRRCRRSSLPWQAPAGVLEIVERSGLRRASAFRRHPDVQGPMTFGVFHPVIVCPLDVATWSDQDLTRAMTHEIEHVRRYDWLTLVLARMICASLWFHPLVWTAWRRMRLEAERACDDAVLRDAEPTAYAEQLVSLARGMTPSLPFLAMAYRDDLSARIRALLDSRRPRGRAGAARVAAVGLLTISMVALIGAVRGVAIAQSDVPALRPGFSVVSPATPGALLGPNPNPLTVQTNLRQTEWSIYGTEHFELFHHGDLNANVTAIGEDAERAYRQIATDLSHDLIKRVPIVLIADPSDLPSNVSANFGPPFNDAEADRMFLPINRPEQVAGLLRHELTHVFAFDLLPPGTNNGALPNWFYEGLAEHERGGWSAEDESVVRDAIRADAVPRLAVGQPVSATDPRFVIAHAFFDFVQSEYGKAGVRQLSSAFGRQGRDVYTDAFGVDAEAVDRQFQRYVRLRFER